MNTKKTCELVRANPKVDKAQIREVLKMVRELEAMGIKKKQYDLASPWTCPQI
jgi:hypothetical protein